MRLQPLIVLAFGLVLASFIVFERQIEPLAEEIRKNPYRGVGHNREDMEAADDSNNIFRIFHAAVLIGHPVALIALFVCLVKVSMPAYRYRFPENQPPENDTEMLMRLYGQELSPPQFSILTLLAAMVAVSIVCAACAYPLK